MDQSNPSKVARRHKSCQITHYASPEGNDHCLAIKAETEHVLEDLGVCLKTLIVLAGMGQDEVRILGFEIKVEVRKVLVCDDVGGSFEVF